MTSTPLEDQVHDALHRRVDPMQHSPLTVTDVRQRARRIQRRRTIAAGAAVAAALAVAVPVGLAMNGPAQRSDFPPATQTPTPTITGPVLIDPRSASVVEGLSVPLVDVTGPSLNTDGETIALPKAYDTVTPYLDRWVGVANDEGNLTLDFLTPDFRVEDRGGPTGGLVVSPAGHRIAWTEYTGSRWQVVTSDVAGDEAWTYTRFPPGPPEAVVRPVGFASETQVVAVQNDGNGVETTYLADGSAPVEVPSLMKAETASPVTGLVAGITSSDVDGSCSAVVDTEAPTGAVVWGTCDYRLVGFSPDGRHVVGLVASGGEYGSPTLSILDAATGASVVDFEVAAGRRQIVGINDLVAWEDEESVAVTLMSGEQYVVRLGLDGTVERVAGDAITAEPEDFGMRFAEVR